MNSSYQEVLALYYIQVPTEQDILTSLGLSKTEFCRKYGFDAASLEGQQSAARQMTLYIIYNLRKQLIACGAPTRLASSTAMNAVINNDPSLAPDSHRGFARGLEHTDRDLKLFMQMMNHDALLLSPASYTPGNLEHGPGENAVSDPFIGWPGIAADDDLDELALRPAPLLNFNGLIKPAAAPSYFVNPEVLTVQVRHQAANVPLQIRLGLGMPTSITNGQEHSKKIVEQRNASAEPRRASESSSIAGSEPSPKSAYKMPNVYQLPIETTQKRSWQAGPGADSPFDDEPPKQTAQLKKAILESQQKSFGWRPGSRQQIE